MTDQSELSIDNIRLYIVGDIHGRSDLLDRIVDEIHRDIDVYGYREGLTITLGDYVDRGPDSRGVLDRLSRNPFPTNYVALRGNHEVLFESFLYDCSGADIWRQQGGLETLHSYGIAVNDLMRGRGVEEAARALRASVPKEHLAFLSSLKNYLSIDPYFFCHAGVRPGVPLEQQKINDLLWIRDEFLNSNFAYENKMVIHGHSARDWPEIKTNRINIDTGAYATGRLTCLVIEGRAGGRFLFTA